MRRTRTFKKAKAGGTADTSNERDVPPRMLVWTLEECVVTALLLLFLTHFYIPVLEPVQNSLFAATSEEMTVVGQSINLGIWLVAILLMVCNRGRILSGMRTIPWAIWFACFTLLSAMWSQDPGVTIRKSLFLLLTTVFGVYFAVKYPVERQLRMICVTAFMIACLSICFALFLPKYGIDHDVHQGVWMGVFTQKNVCARAMLFLLACVLSYTPATWMMQKVRWLTIISVGLITLETGSKTAYVMAVMLISFFLIMRAMRKFSQSLIVLLVSGSFAIGGVLCGLALSAAPAFVALLGRDTTFTGRTEIWRAVLEAIFKRPYIGYGFAAFWLSLRGESANIVLALRWAVPAAHNGFLEVWLQLGAVGLVLFVTGFVVAGIAAIRGYRRPSAQEAIWPLAVLLLTLVYNLDESSLMQPNDFLWVLYIATLVNLARLKSKGSERPAPPGFLASVPVSAT